MLRATTVLESLQDRHPGRFTESRLRTPQGRMRDWRALGGPEPEANLRQVLPAGRGAQMGLGALRRDGSDCGGGAIRPCAVPVRAEPFGMAVCAGGSRGRRSRCWCGGCRGRAGDGADRQPVGGDARAAAGQVLVAECAVLRSAGALPVGSRPQICAQPARPTAACSGASPPDRCVPPLPQKSSHVNSCRSFCAVDILASNGQTEPANVGVGHVDRQSAPPTRHPYHPQALVTNDVPNHDPVTPWFSISLGRSNR